MSLKNSKISYSGSSRVVKDRIVFNLELVRKVNKEIRGEHQKNITKKPTSKLSGHYSFIIRIFTKAFILSVVSRNFPEIRTTQIKNKILVC